MKITFSTLRRTLIFTCFCIAIFQLQAPLLGQAASPKQWEKQWALLKQEIDDLNWKGKYKQAFMLAKQALELVEKNGGENHPALPKSLDRLATGYEYQGNYDQAEKLYQKALELDKKIYGPQHFFIGERLNNLGLLYIRKGQYKKAEPLLKRALAITEKTEGSRKECASGACSFHTLLNLAVLYDYQAEKSGNYDQAAIYYKRALERGEQAFSRNDSEVAKLLNNFAMVYSAQEKYVEAEAFLKRALAIWKKNFGSNHPHVGAALNNLGTVYMSQKSYKKAEKFFKKSLKVKKNTLGMAHHDTITSLENLENLYWDMDQPKKAKAMAWRIHEILEDKE